MWGTLALVAGLAVAAVAAAPGAARAQNAVFRGVVRADNGEPIIGANVYVVELNVQAATNETGHYLITVPGTRVRGQQLQLRVRAIGYRPSSRPVTVTAGEQTVDYSLAADINRLEEIVVTGVLEGTEQKKLPFTVSSVDMSEVPVPPADAIRLLAGRVAGANVTSATGRPGSAPSIILRGPTSINATGRGQGPLFIVDGVIISGSLPDINPTDIENIEVVKGAAAASLYGARAGNGVIQITTRSGRRAADGMTFNVRVEGGGSDIERDLGLTKTTTLLTDETGTRFCASVTGQPLCARTVDWNAEAARVNNEPGDFALAPVNFPLDPGASTPAGALRNSYQTRLWPGRVYNPVQQVIQPQSFWTSTVDMTARFNNTQVYGSASGLDQAGSIRFLKGFERYSGRLNVDQRLSDSWNVSLRTYYARSWQDGYNQETGNNDAFFRITRQRAIENILATDTLGRLYIRADMQSAGAQNQNPLQGLQNYPDVGVTDRFLGGLTFRWTPAAWADLEGNFSYDFQNFQERAFYDKGYRTTSANTTTNNGFIYNASTRSQAFNTSLNLTLRHSFGRDIAGRASFRYLFEQQDVASRSGQGNFLAAVGVPTLNNATQGYSLGSSATTVRGIGMFGGAGLDIMNGRYNIDGLIRRDGSSLFGAANRWATFGRVSAAWNVALEPWWFAPNSISALKLRGSRGSAGGRPSFSAQYETWSVSSSGVSFGTLGNRDLKPEVTVDNEVGADIELFRRALLTVTYATGETRNQILLVPNPAEKGFSQQWQNAGTLANKTWEASLNLPILRSRDISWTWTFTYDRTRTRVTALSVPSFTYGPTNAQAANAMFLLNVGEEYATMYGRGFVKHCGDLPTAFQADCGGANTSFQYNNDGFVVWTGSGNSWHDGITRNLWGTSLPDAQSPWGVGLNFGTPIIIRSDACITAPTSGCAAKQIPLGSGLPSMQFSVSQTFQWHRLSVYALLQGVLGRHVWDQGFAWALLDYNNGISNQRGATVETAKPIGYYWRAKLPDNSSGIGGLYDILGPNNYAVEDAGYAKLRELSLSYNIGPVGGVGNWTASVVGRNLYTFSGYRGFDPEVGNGTGISSSAAVGSIDAFAFPNTRSLTLALSTSF
jgi:TonB-linked SusC/RagA family outer membrane protein